MRNREDPTERSQELTLAAGAASLLLSTAVNRVAKKRMREREATTAEEADHWAPTEVELQALRQRFIEYQALDEAARSSWRLSREHPTLELMVTAAKAAYRIVVFSAGSVVLYQFIMHGRV